MIAMVDDLMGRGVIGDAASQQPWPAPPTTLAGGLPESLRQLIDHQLDRLRPEERRVLEVASVAGMEFSAAVVAAALDTDVLEVEGCGEALAHSPAPVPVPDPGVLGEPYRARAAAC